MFSLLLSWSAFSLYAQSDKVKAYVEQGIALHDKGDYKGAIEEYQKALALDAASPMVNYEIASSYFAAKDYDKALKHINVTLQKETEFADHAYILKGSVLDLQGKSKEAIAVYKNALRTHQDNYLLYYNLALTLFNSKASVTETTDALKHALRLNADHASSHLLLGYVMMDQGKRVQSLLALYNFLLLEPKSGRAEEALGILLQQLQQGVERTDEKTINILASNKTVKDEFAAAELSLSLLEASKTLEKNKDKTEHELFVDNTKTFFSLMGNLKKDHKGFWWDFYVPFFAAMESAGHTETFGYYIWLSKNNVKVNQWLDKNDSRIKQFSKWYEDYKR